MFDSVEIGTFLLTFLSFSVLFYFLPTPLVLKILFISAAVFFVLLFSFCSYWAAEWHPERKFVIGFWVSFLHTFLFFLGSFLGFSLTFLLECFKGF
jgi:hypothetical protein